MLLLDRVRLGITELSARLCFEIVASCVDLYGPWTYVPGVAYLGPDAGNVNLLRPG